MFTQQGITQTRLQVDDMEVPVRVYAEERENVRMSLSKTGAILRIPSALPTTEQELLWQQFYTWAEAHLKGHKGLHRHFNARGYYNGDELNIYNRKYKLNIHTENRKSHKATLVGQNIYLHLSASDTGHDMVKAVRKLISRAVAKDCLPEFARRVDALNFLYFQCKVKSVNLNYSLSKWGSCADDGSMNFSTRLLFAPQDVIDYVIIHELAHLVEMNHTNQYWDLVDHAMPDYLEKEHWLKVNGHLCNF